jgi:hypothetical protein
MAKQTSFTDVAGPVVDHAKACLTVDGTLMPATVARTLPEGEVVECHNAMQICLDKTMQGWVCASDNGKPCCDTIPEPVCADLVQCAETTGLLAAFEEAGAKAPETCPNDLATASCIDFQEWLPPPDSECHAVP